MVESSKLTDRACIHAPNHIPGQKPVTVGHEYSLVVYLPEDEEDRKAHWTCPLSIRRVRSNETGPQTGLGQVQELMAQTLLKYEPPQPFNKYVIVGPAPSIHTNPNAIALQQSGKSP
jgi:hypothetical protein